MVLTRDGAGRTPPIGRESTSTVVEFTVTRRNHLAHKCGYIYTPATVRKVNVTGAWISKQERALRTFGTITLELFSPVLFVTSPRPVAPNSAHATHPKTTERYHTNDCLPTMSVLRARVRDRTGGTRADETPSRARPPGLDGFRRTNTERKRSRGPRPAAADGLSTRTVAATATTHRIP